MSDRFADQFESFLWRGQKRYKCNRVWEGGAPCSYDTYDLDAMAEHVAGPHSRSGKVPKAAPPTPKVVSPIVDEYERPIVREIDPQFRNARFKDS